MAVLNIRVEDRIRDQLKEMADGEGVTVSEYVRDLVMAAIVPVYELPKRHGDEHGTEDADRRPAGALDAAPHPRAGAARGCQRR